MNSLYHKSDRNPLIPYEQLHIIAPCFESGPLECECAKKGVTVINRGSTVYLSIQVICHMDASDYVIIDPQTRFGKPTIKGTRISVGDVLLWFANGMTISEMLDGFP